jgi:hypothetical protein
LTVYDLDLQKAVRYAGKWAYGRNPAWFDFDGLGGDCTNFISQCIYAAGAGMNYTKDVGWYYVSLNNRAAAWTGVEYFYRFMMNNTGVGPFGREVPLADVRVGDVVQLGADGRFYHSLLVVDLKNGQPFVACHTADAYNRPLFSYMFDIARVLRIDRARRW